MADDMTNSTASDDTKNPSVTPLSTGLAPSDYVIIGGTGDLALRKILPALFWRYLDGQITTDYRIAAASRRAISMDEFAGKLRPFCEDAFASGRADADRLSVRLEPGVARQESTRRHNWVAEPGRRVFCANKFV